MACHGIVAVSWAANRRTVAATIAAGGSRSIHLRAEGQGGGQGETREDQDPLKSCLGC